MIDKKRKADISSNDSYASECASWLATTRQRRHWERWWREHNYRKSSAHYIMFVFMFTLHFMKQKMEGNKRSASIELKKDINVLAYRIIYWFAKSIFSSVFMFFHDINNHNNK